MHVHGAAAERYQQKQSNHWKTEDIILVKCRIILFSYNIVHPKNRVLYFIKIYYTNIPQTRCTWISGRFSSLRWNFCICVCMKQVFWMNKEAKNTKKHQTRQRTIVGQGEHERCAQDGNIAWQWYEYIEFILNLGNSFKYSEEFSSKCVYL